MNMFSGEAAECRPRPTRGETPSLMGQPPGCLRGSGVGGTHGGNVFGSEAGAVQAETKAKAQTPTHQS